MGARISLEIVVLLAWELPFTRFGEVQGSPLELERSRAHFWNDFGSPFGHNLCNAFLLNALPVPMLRQVFSCAWK